MTTRARVFEKRWFAGFTVEETARFRNSRNVKRDYRLAHDRSLRIERRTGHMNTDQQRLDALQRERVMTPSWRSADRARHGLETTRRVSGDEIVHEEVLAAERAFCAAVERA